MDAMQAGKSLGAAVLAGGLVIQVEAQELCPVDSGTLQASANTYMES